MAHFFLRPELHNHDVGDYEQLHRELASVGFYRVIKLTDNLWYDLPTGEYHKNSANTIEVEYTAVTAAVQRVVNNNMYKTKDYWLVLTDSSSQAVRLKLRRTTEQSKLPPGETV